MLQRNNAPAWGVLVLLTVVCTALLELARMPAASFLGGIAAGILMSMRGAGIQVPTSLFLAGQSLVGCMIARSFSLAILRGMLENWLLALAIVVAVLACAFFLGWIMTVKQILPGTTAIWGASPGGGMVMTLMSASYGADMRLVAFMQYLRVVVVSVIAAVVAWALGAQAPAAAASFISVLFPPVAWGALLLTLTLAFSSAFAGHLTRVPAGPVLLPMVTGTAAQNAGLLVLELPGWLLVLCFSLIGWCIGLRFNRPVFFYAVRVLPKLLAAVLFLLALCGILALLLVWGAGIDPLTAYLATSPGGLDAVAIIALSSGVDLVFVMAIQTARLILVLLFSPILARFASGRVGKKLPSALFP